ncbi:MAG TPA: STAS domain-containing protein [Pyrinomonadaceae bacterium]|jgi:anti-anti-sigma factor|nr:STAS domain-containing protein [Pyrinomonadaceae bacterium]
MLKVHTRKLGNVAVVSVQGRIVNGETASLRHEVDSQSRVNTVLLDLSRVSTIDASGLGLMLEMREETQSRGMRFKLMNVTNLVSRVLAITKLDSVFEITPAAEQMPALAHARAPRMMPYARCA